METGSFVMRVAAETARRAVLTLSVKVTEVGLNVMAETETGVMVSTREL